MTRQVLGRGFGGSQLGCSVNRNRISSVTTLGSPQMPRTCAAREMPSALPASRIITGSQSSAPCGFDLALPNRMRTKRISAATITPCANSP